ncbi:MAG TPA: hypothetical protein VJ201_00430 [Candidatus Babeliales bacterium]|nr:hypothetical protein [Candidatus Babeliales bacterium]
MYKVIISRHGGGYSPSTINAKSKEAEIIADFLSTEVNYSETSYKKWLLGNDNSTAGNSIALERNGNIIRLSDQYFPTEGEAILTSEYLITLIDKWSIIKKMDLTEILLSYQSKEVTFQAISGPFLEKEIAIKRSQKIRKVILTKHLNSYIPIDINENSSQSLILAQLLTSEKTLMDIILKNNITNPTIIDKVSINKYDDRIIMGHINYPRDLDFLITPENFEKMIKDWNNIKNQGITEILLTWDGQKIHFQTIGEPL